MITQVCFSDPRHEVPDSIGEAIAAEEFASAMTAYKLRSGRSFPTWSEVLEVLRGLGYRKAGDGSHPETVRLAFKIKVEREGSQGWEIQRTLARMGGVPLDPPSRRVYGFASGPDREMALDAIRQRHGWTCVERDQG